MTRSLGFVLALATMTAMSTSSCSCSDNGQGSQDGGGDDQGIGDSGGGGSGGGDLAGQGQPCSGGQACPGGQQCNNGTGTCGCPPYQTFCNGQCIPAAIDPTNCGGCNVMCTGGTVCSGGKCEANCLPGYTNCGGSCVDLTSDNDNCHTCGNKCGMGTGCSNSACVAAKTFPTPAACAGGGPQINVPTPGGGNVCAGNLAQTTFTWALCSCNNIGLQDLLFTDAYDSTKGPYMPGGLGGGVGLNGSLTSMGALTVGGTLWDSAASGLNTSSHADVLQELHVGGPVNADITVSDDAYVSGNLSGGPIVIKKTLFHPGGMAGVSGTTAGMIVDQPVTVPPPCAACPNQPAGAIPVAMMVAAKMTNNDNASIGLDPLLFSKAGAPQRLDLPCGSYYLDSVAGGATIYAHGHVALFIQKDVSATTFTLAPDATFDIFIAGTINAQSGMTIGNANYPALTRTYVGSSTAVTFGDLVTLAGNFYDAAAHLDWSAGVDAYGAVYAGDFSGSSAVRIHYDLAVINSGMGCPPGGSSTSPPPDGSTPTGCNSCTDCNNQACVNGMCGACTSSAQCCAPLQCINGTCTIPIL
jgi:hypothetical protein